MSRQLNIKRAEDTISLLLLKLLSDNIINQEDIDKVIDYIYEDEQPSNNT